MHMRDQCLSWEYITHKNRASTGDPACKAARAYKKKRRAREDDPPVISVADTKVIITAQSAGSWKLKQQVGLTVSRKAIAKKLSQLISFGLTGTPFQREADSSLPL